MHKLFITFASALLVLLNSNQLLAQKAVYIPTFITDAKMDLNDPASQWSYSRSKQSDNIILFWEAGFGADPSTATGVYKVDIEQLMANAEKCYTYYIDSLQFVSKGTSVTDKYKLMIFLLHSTEWAAYGSGQDDKVGSLHVNPAAANIKTVVAHEIGHCFQYITGCDTKGGFRYGLGENGDGGNGFWEQCAQWMAFKVYPEQKFNDRDFKYYTKSTYKHILHEDPRYSNFFIQDYWAFKRGLYAIGKIWRESTKSEDPIETYKRLFQLSQEKFNDEIYEQAAKLTTWDLPAIKKDGAAFIDTRKQTKMNLVDGSWRIDTTECLQNYGYNSIKLKAPTVKTKVKVQFKGLAGEANYTTINKPVGGWRFGFVALLKDGTRVYSKMMKANVQNDKNPTQKLSFTCPDNCTNLWLVVSGAPQAHSRHPWDDNPANDEEWPYKIKFTNTTYK